LSLTIQPGQNRAIQKIQDEPWPLPEHSLRGRRAADCRQRRQAAGAGAEVGVTRGKRCRPCALLHSFSALIATVVRLNERLHIDRICVSSRRSLETSILLDRQRSMENIALNDAGAT